jgi:hypothetical protein
MQMLVTRKTGSLLAATACGAALIVLAVVDPAAAQKGSNFKSTTTGTIKPSPSPRVRDHRGEPPKFVAPGARCGWGRPGPCPIKVKKGNIRDHRSK